MKTLIKYVATLMLLFVSFYSSAQNMNSDSNANSNAKEFKQAINFCPIAIAFGIYSANYERLLNDHHGIMIRGDIESIPKSFADGKLNVSGKDAILNYRYHINGGLKSLFVGTFARYRVYNGDIRSQPELDSQQIFDDFKLSEVTIGANTGKRFIFKSGFNVNLSAGYGIFMDKMSISNSTNDNIEAIHAFQKEYDLYNGMYGEISIGYAF